MPFPVYELEEPAEHNSADGGPTLELATTYPAQVIRVVRQAVAMRVLEVMPQGAQVCSANGIGIAIDSLEKIGAVEFQKSIWFHLKLSSFDHFEVLLGMVCLFSLISPPYFPYAPSASFPRAGAR